MSKLGTRRHAVDILFTLALFCVLAASSILVMVMGVHVYQGIAQRMSTNFDLRTSLTYISTKLRQNDTAGAIYVTDFGGQEALALDQTVGDSVYRTLIYQYNGSLCELFAAKDVECLPEDGQPIMDIERFTFTNAGEGLIRLSVLDSRNYEASLLIHPRCAQTPA